MTRTPVCNRIHTHSYTVIGIYGARGSISTDIAPQMCAGFNDTSSESLVRHLNRVQSMWSSKNRWIKKFANNFIDTFKKPCLPCHRFSYIVYIPQAHHSQQSFTYFLHFFLYSSPLQDKSELSGEYGQSIGEKCCILLFMKFLFSFKS